MASVDLGHVEKRYPNGTRAVVDCTVHVADGELLVLVGPSGCGKSTLLRLVAGLEELTAGEVRIGGAVVNALTPQERNVAMVFQDYALYPHMSVRHNLEFPLKMRRLSRTETAHRVAWVTNLLNLGSLLDRLPKQLSGGERQRVAMGRALVREPAVSLLDEPLSNLDAKLRVQVRAEIAELQRRTNTTMIYVTHDQVEAMTLGNRVAVMHEGRVQQIGSPQELYDRPATTFVAAFVGNPPMNLFPTCLAVDAHGRTAITIGGSSITLAPAAKPVPPAGGTGLRLTAGIRPEALRLAVREHAGHGLQAVVEHVEWLGHETLAHLRSSDPVAANGIRLVARLPGMRALAKGEVVSLEVDADRVHLFGEDGRALRAAGETP